MQVKVLQNAPSEHSAILLTFIKIPFVFKTFFLILSGRIRQVLLYLSASCKSWNVSVAIFFYSSSNLFSVWYRALVRGWNDIDAIDVIDFGPMVACTCSFDVSRMSTDVRCCYGSCGKLCQTRVKCEQHGYTHRSR